VNTNYHYHEYQVGGRTHRYRQEWIGEIELRFEPQDDEDLDEVVLSKHGECLIHLERMDDNCIWMALYEPGTPRRLVIHFRPLDLTPSGVTWDIEDEWTDEDKAAVAAGQTYADIAQARKDRLERDGDHDFLCGPWTICEGWGGDDDIFDELFFKYQGKCILHMERMDECTMWMHVNDGKKGVHLWIGPTERHQIDVADWDEDAWNDTKPDEKCLCGSGKLFKECCDDQGTTDLASQ